MRMLRSLMRGANPNASIVIYLRNRFFEGNPGERPNF
ncbi:hypothetical protein [Coxiella endosymbiont of Ornithodoros maritimus]|nr:hypothetical protein [Coxiella endosymbiont of Ornithodoros maritimus]